MKGRKQKREGGKEEKEERESKNVHGEVLR